MKKKNSRFKDKFKQYITFAKQLFVRVNEVDVFGLGAQLAYFFLLSMFPFLLFLVSLLAFLPIDDHVIIEFIGVYLPGSVVEMIDTNLNSLLNNRQGSLLSISIIGTLWSASNGFNAIKKSFNRAYRIEKKQPFIVERLISVILTVAILGVICIALLLPVFGKAIGSYLFSMINLAEGFEEIWSTLRWAISSVIFFIVLYVLYRIVPNVSMKWHEPLWGTLFATVGWQLVSFGFSFYVNTLGNYSATYGSLGTVIILMFWFYISGIIIITGGVINAFLKEQNSGGD